MAMLIAVYLGMTLAYHYVLPMTEVIGADKTEAGSREGGRRGLLPALAGCLRRARDLDARHVLDVISLNGNALTGPRAYFAMARDGLLPRGLGRVHPRFQTPANAVLAQGIWAILLTIAGTVLILVPPPELP